MTSVDPIEPALIPDLELRPIDDKSAALWRQVEVLHVDTLGRERDVLAAVAAVPVELRDKIVALQHYADPSIPFDDWVAAEIAKIDKQIVDVAEAVKGKR